MVILRGLLRARLCCCLLFMALIVALLLARILIFVLWDLTQKVNNHPIELSSSSAKSIPIEIKSTDLIDSS